MKRLLIIIIACGIFRISEGMENSQEINREIEINFNSRTLVLDIQTTNKIYKEEVHMTKVNDEQFKVSVPISVMLSVFTHDPLIEAKVQSLLTSLNTSRFGINPNIDFVLMDDSNERFNKLFAELSDSIYKILPYCSSTHIETIIIKHLKICSGTCTQTAYTAISTFSNSKSDEISRVESYFYNVSEKLDILIDMISQRK